MLLLVVIASRVSGVSVCLLLSSHMNPQCMEGLVWKFMVSSSCFHLVCCSCEISSFIYLFSV